MRSPGLLFASPFDLFIAPVEFRPKLIQKPCLTFHSKNVEVLFGGPLTEAKRMNPSVEFRNDHCSLRSDCISHARCSCGTRGCFSVFISGEFLCGCVFSACWNRFFPPDNRRSFGGCRPQGATNVARHEIWTRGLLAFDLEKPRPSTGARDREDQFRFAAKCAKRHPHCSAKRSAARRWPRHASTSSSRGEPASPRAWGPRGWAGT